MDASEIRALADIMVACGLTEIVRGDVTLRRPPPTPEESSGKGEDPFTIFAKMKPGEQERIMRERGMR